MLLLKVVLIGALLKNFIGKGDCQCTNNSVRLIGGSGNYEGNVQVCINGIWGFVCDTGWNSTEANIVCLQLGYSSSTVTVRQSSYYGFGYGTIWLNNVACSGLETNLLDCTHEINGRCEYDKMAGVFCPFGGTGCTNGDIRLANFHTVTYGRSEGRVEVCHNHKWGTVCDDGWNSNDAMVVCRQLGYKNYINYLSKAYFGAGTGPIWLDNLYCQGKESSVFACTSNAIGVHNCDHNEDAGVICYTRNTSSCAEGSVMLWSAYTSTQSNEGIVLVCRSGSWYPIYDTSSCHVATLVCKAIGHTSVAYKRVDAGKYYGYYYSKHYYFSCSKFDQKLSDCSAIDYGKQYLNSLGLKCETPISTSNCTNGAIQLVNGDEENNGRVEYCYNRDWAPFCSLDAHTATVVCKTLGYKDWSYIFSDERYSTANTKSRFKYLSCPNSNVKSEQCSVVISCYNTMCFKQYGLVCNDTCTYGDVRLVGGSDNYEGNVQLCFNGTWGYVCDNNWNANDAKVVCSQLGYSKTNAVYRHSSFYGYDEGAVWLDKVACTGSENELLLCQSGTGPGNADCGSYEIAGVFCPNGDTCKNGEIRLANFYPDSYGRSEGRVEVCRNRAWGTICNDGWSSNDATVACRQLGYSNYINYYTYAYYGAGSGSIWLTNIKCNGKESSLFSCPASSIPSYNCRHSEDPGIRCYSNENSICSDGAVKLWSAFSSTPDNEGILLICKSGTWYPIHDNSDCRAAGMACISAGHYSAEYTRTNAGKYYGYYYKTHYKYSCSKFDWSLADCTQSSYSNQYSNSLGVRCVRRKLVPIICTNGNVQLSRGKEGRIEYCHNNDWVPMCSISTLTAKIICSQYGSDDWTIIADERYGRVDTATNFHSLTCSRSNATLSECSAVTLCSHTLCSTQYGLECHPTCTNDDVRLVGGSGDYEGNVQVCINKTWGYICDNGWDVSDSTVVCSQLGYTTSNVVYKTGSYYGFGEGMIWLESVSCSGAEKKFVDCSHALNIGDVSCSHAQLAGVYCPGGGIACVNGDIRLATFYSNSYGRSEGRVEVCYNSQWGTVCDNSWGSSDAIVACKQLGHYGYISYYRYAYYGSGTGPVWLSYLYCNGGESSLFNCSSAYSIIERRNCYHYEDASTKCYSRDFTSCSNGAVKLWSAYDSTPDNEGIVLLCISGVWYPLYQTSDCNAAKMACNQAGFRSVKYTRNNAGKHYGYYYYTHYRVSCSSSSGSLLDCSRTSYGYAYTSSFGVKCESPSTDSKCTNGTVRLINGKGDHEGRVEYCFYGEWTAMCSLNRYAAKLICNTFDKTEWSIVIDEHFGRVDKISNFQYLSCSASDAQLSDCSVITSCSPANCSIQYGIVCDDNCTYGDVRLVGGSGDYEGNVQVCINGSWGHVCHNSWSADDAKVVCKQLGYSTSYATYRQSSFYGFGSGIIWLDKLYCTGSEAKLMDCPRGSEVGSTVCDYKSISGVFCPYGVCTDGDIRLANFYTNSYGRSEGRVEVCHNNKWGTVCNDYWDSNEATVACKQLGFHAYINYYSYAYYGSGTGSIWLDNLQCQGNEGNLFICPGNGIGVHNCGHNEDVGVRCYKRETSGCLNGAVKLWSAFESTPNDEGIVLYCRSGTWYPVYQSTDCIAATVACKDAGYSYVKYTRTNAGYYYGYYYINYHIRFQCSNSATHLSSCSQNNYYSYSYYTSSLGVKCGKTSSMPSCKNGSVHLSNGKGDMEGRVEYCFSGEWAAMCSLSSNTAKLICRKYGYEEWKIVSDEHFGRLYATSNFQTLSCSSSNTDLSECSVVTSCTQLSCSKQYGLRCSDSCTNGNVRLVGGSGEYEGNVQVCFNETWGYVCQRSWDNSDTKVVCSQLGFSTSNFAYKTGSYYGIGDGKIWLDSAYCTGQESKLTDCNFGYEIGTATCDYSQLVGVFCYGNGVPCANGDIRLANTGSSSYSRSEGRIEVCHDTKWGTVCDDGWGSSDATVACKQLGYYNYINYYRYAYYGYGSGSIWLSYLRCNGGESSLFACSANSIGSHHCSHHEDAGVMCYSRDVSSCTNGDVKLWSAYRSTPDDEGIVLLCIGGTWYPLHQNSDCFAAKIACHQAGYHFVKYTRNNAGKFYGYYYRTHYRALCSSSTASLLGCSRTSYGSAYTSSFGVKCESLRNSSCTDGDIRLSDGKEDNEGRVEYCYNGEWAAMCLLSRVTAKLICDHFGMLELGSIVTDEMFGRVDIISNFQYLTCSTSNNKLSQCSVITTCAPTNCSIQYGIRCSENCTNGDVRLVGGSDDYEGNVQVCSSGKWGYVCDTNWDSNDATVVCKQLGYSTSRATSRQSSFYGYGSGKIWLDKLNCTGSEATLMDCPRGVKVGDAVCDYTDIAGAFCPYGACTEGEIRLANFYINSYGRSEGRVEVCHSNAWGTVCDDYWGGSDSTVACKQLGYYNYITYYYSAYYGQGSGSIWLDNLHCGGSETSLFSCSSNGIGSHNCRHRDDVGVVCYSRDFSSCSHGAVKLWSAYDSTPKDEGIMLSCISGTWYPLYYTSDCKVAELACEALGYGGMDYMRNNAGRYYGYYYYPHYFYSCSSTDQSFSECSRSRYGYQYRYSLGVKCKSPNQFTNCTNGEIRLTGSEKSTEGRPEYCYRNIWKPICLLNDITARIICNSFGYKEWGIVTDERYGRPDSTSRFHNLSCFESSTNISQCSLTLGSCSTSSCSVQYGLICSDICIQGKVRLVGGSGKYEGNVQVCINGTWGYVCDNKWGINNAKVVCSQLGYSKSNVVHRLSSYYGYGFGTILLDQVECKGSEAELIECSHGGSIFCEYKDLAGVYCPSKGLGCSSSEIRLANFYSNSYGRSEGRVEVCYNNEWGTVCDDSWSSSDATVACKQLGYYGYINYYSNAYYGSGVGSIWLSYLRCNGGESSLFSCSANQIGYHHCGHYEDAGLKCFSRDVSSCSSGSVKLWSAFSSTPSNEGIVLICKGGFWYPLLDSSNCRAAEIACNATGHSEVTTIRTNGGKYYGYYYSTHYYYSCSQNDNTLSECDETSYSNQHYYNSLSVVCELHIGTLSNISKCTDGDVRLVDGNSKNEGRVDYCYNGEWVPMCSLSIITAELICKKLNYTGNSHVIVSNADSFDVLSNVSKFQSLSCSSSYSDLTQCSVTTTCFPTTCANQYGVKCNETCEYGNVHLVGGSGDFEGNVQVCVNGTWGYVCDNNWNTNDAQVVCSQLGYSTSNVKHMISSFYGYGDGDIWLDGLYCSGSEEKLIDCPHNTNIQTAVCDYRKMAGVFCQSGGGNCNNGDIRLVHTTSSYGRSEGRLEVCHKHHWGTVCSDGWDSTDATVACKQLGYHNYINYHNYYEAGSGSIWLSNINCQGGERSLFLCSSNKDENRCNHYQDVGIKCYSKDASSCSNGAVKLWSAFKNTPSDEGIVLICKSGIWYPIYYTSDCMIAELACKAAGFSHVQYVRSNAGKYYGYYYSTHYRYSCTSFDQHLWECTEQNYGTQYYNSLGLKCELPTPSSNCTDGDVRLTGGKSSIEGRVEYCYNGYWTAMCDLSSPTARLICQKLGHSEWALIFSDEQFGRLNMRSTFHSLSCSSTFTDLSQCSVSATCTLTVCSTEYSLRCYDSSNKCYDGDIRLVDGEIEQEGRPEVCVNGIWGSICHNGWTTSDAYATCLTLGFEGTSSPTIYFNSNFGPGNGPILWSYVTCNFWDKNVFDCSKRIYPFFSCTSSHVSGMTCTEGCSNADVRLVGGEYENEGTVEVCFNDLWGLISDVGWTSADAKVVCNQLGHKGGTAKPILNSHYIKPRKTIHLKNVFCLGDESDLSECTSTQLSLSAGKKLLPNTEVAGVDCIYDEPTPPPCIVTPDADPSDSCSTEGSIRLMKNGVESRLEGRVEYCNGEFWTPLCTMDNRAATVACGQLGHTQYQWGSIFSADYEEFGALLNYSLVENVTCSGSESHLSECIKHKPGGGCLPWCPSNIGLRCFDSKSCEDGSVRLADGVIEQEGRVEVCVNEVWGSLCDDGWDKTDGYVVCQQLGYPQLEPIIFYNSHFGAGLYPSVYSNVKCGGWESKLSQCEKDGYLNAECLGGNTAGLLCGYDCKDGDVQLVGGESDNEGTIEVCFDHIWGLISETGWTSRDAQVVCKQMGYQVDGTIVKSGSFYGKPNKTVHLSNVHCTGEEKGIDDCTHTKYSLAIGKNKLQTVNVAGVKCYISSTMGSIESKQSLSTSTSNLGIPVVSTTSESNIASTSTPQSLATKSTTANSFLPTVLSNDSSARSESLSDTLHMTRAVFGSLVTIMALIILLLALLLILSITRRRWSNLLQNFTKANKNEVSSHDMCYINSIYGKNEDCIDTGEIPEGQGSCQKQSSPIEKEDLINPEEWDNESEACTNLDD